MLLIATIDLQKKKKYNENIIIVNSEVWLVLYCKVYFIF